MENEKVIDKIKKLLKLAQSSNEHEAALAAARAAQLMAEHQIAEAMLSPTEGKPEDVGEESISGMASRIPWKGCIAFAAAKAYGGSMYWRRWDKITIQIVGTPAVIATVIYVIRYLWNEVDRLAALRWNDVEDSFHDPKPRQWKGNFRLGAAHTIAERLKNARHNALERAAAAARQARANEPSLSTALMRINADDQRVQEYLKPLSLRTSPRAKPTSDEAYAAGKAAGEKVDLGEAGNRRGLGTPAKQVS